MDRSIGNASAAPATVSECGSATHSHWVTPGKAADQDLRARIPASDRPVRKRRGEAVAGSGAFRFVRPSPPVPVYSICPAAGTRAGKQGAVFMRFTLCLATLAVAGTTAFPPSSNADDGAIVVTATRQAMRANELIADTSVISREDIEASGATTLSELLARQPGIEYSRTGGRGAAESVYIRGANAGHTLVLVDGLRVGSATLGQTALEQIPLGQIERIEIVRGPGSALYGTDAIGGVLQIFTRRGASAPPVSFSVGYGSQRTYETAVSFAGATGPLQYNLNLGAGGSGGINAVRNADSGAFNPDDDGFRNRSGSAHLGYRFDANHEAGADYFRSRGESRYDSGWPSRAYDWQSRQTVSGASVYARNRFLPEWTSTLRIGTGRDDQETTPSSNPGQAADAFRTRQRQVTWQNDVALPVGGALLALERVRQEVDSTETYTVAQRTIASALLGWNGRIDNHRLQANLRRDRNSQFGSKTTGAFGYGYQFTGTLRASLGYATAFKAPTLNDLYYPNKAFIGVGNPNLQPETARNREAALHYDDGRHQASLVLFRNSIANLIQWDETSPGSWFYTPMNVGRARIGGATLSYRADIGGWNLYTHYNLQNPRDTDTDKLLARRARQFGALGASTGRDAWRLGAEIRLSGARYDDAANTRRLGGYAVANLFGEHRLDRDWAAFGRLDNLFDRHYTLARSSTTEYAVLGRTVFVGVRYAPK